MKLVSKAIVAVFFEIFFAGVLEKYGERQKIMEQSEVVRKLRNVVCGLR